MRLQRLTLAALAAALVLALGAPSSPAWAATQVGTNFGANNGNCGDVNTVLQTISPNSSYAVPADGVITSWTFQTDVWASPLETLSLVVARPAGGTQYTTVARSADKSPLVNVPNVYSDVRIPVRAGDVLGYFSISGTGPSNCSRTGQPGFEARYLTTRTDPGSTNDFTLPVAGLQLNLSAVLEPDCDSDDLGDESQDQNLSSCPPGPTATITGRPKDKVKTKKNRATATFTFSADDPAATFECALDGKAQFKPCVSPLTVTVRRGGHTFSVTAIDAGGNAGAAATDTWKVKRKRKKKK